MHKSREFQKLLAASFISQTGSHFLTLAIASFIFYTSGSPIKSALIFVVSFLPSILVSSRLGHWVDGNLSRWLIARNELISVFATLLAGLSIALHLPLAVLCVILGLRSLLTFISRAASTKWLKIITPPELQTTRIKVFYLSFFLSTAISGLLAGLVLSQSSIWTVVCLDMASYLLGICVLMTLQRPLMLQTETLESVKAPEASLGQTLATIFAMPVVRTSFIIVCLSQAIFQGAYSVLVSFLPIQTFDLGLSGVGGFQLAASIGITCGFLINWLISSSLIEKQATRPMRAIALASIACLALIISATATVLPVSLVGFFILNLSYECIWLHHNSEFFRASPKAAAARYQFTLSACASFLMATATLAYSALVQYFGVSFASIAIVVLGITSVGLVALAGKRSELVSALERTPS